MNHHRLTHSTWEEGEGEGGRERGIQSHVLYSLQTDTTPLKVHIYVHTYNVLNDCMLTFTPAKTMFLAGEEREVALSTYSLTEEFAQCTHSVHN